VSRYSGGVVWVAKSVRGCNCRMLNVIAMMPRREELFSTKNPWRLGVLAVNSQKTNFNANCNCRIGTVPRIELIVPNAPPPAVGIELFPAAAQLL
jgi:hypothetical protein